MEKLRKENEILKGMILNNEKPHSKGINTSKVKLEHENFE